MITNYITVAVAGLLFFFFQKKEANQNKITVTVTCSFLRKDNKNYMTGIVRLPSIAPLHCTCVVAALFLVLTISYLSV